MSYSLRFNEEHVLKYLLVWQLNNFIKVERKTDNIEPSKRVPTLYCYAVTIIKTIFSEISFVPE